MGMSAIPIDILLQLMRQDGYMYQQSLPLTPPEYTLPIEYFSDIPIGYSWIAEYTGAKCSDIKHIDHPGFTRLRDELENKGYIKTERNCWNGDTVLKAFRLNDHWFEEGDTFPCAAAMKNMFKLENKS
jgi:hypothetical protein